VSAAKIANEIIDVRTGAAFAIVLGIESGSVVAPGGPGKPARTPCHTFWA